jgi:hypothetical protein
VHDDAEALARWQGGSYGVDHDAPLRRVSGVDVEEAALSAEGSYAFDDLRRVREGPAQVKMDAEDVHAGARQRHRGAGAVAAGSA